MLKPPFCFYVPPPSLTHLLQNVRDWWVVVWFCNYRVLPIKLLARCFLRSSSSSSHFLIESCRFGSRQQRDFTSALWSRDWFRLVCLVKWEFSLVRNHWHVKLNRNCKSGRLSFISRNTSLTKNHSKCLALQPLTLKDLLLLCPKYFKTDSYLHWD